MIRRSLTVLLLGFVLLLSLTTEASHAQSLEGLGSGILPELDVRGQGWSQLQNTQEILDFILALFEVVLLTLIISFHPVVLHSRRVRADFELPKVLFLYGLVGMTVGFLVLHHGYIIGFVIFGMGGLLRFRSESTSTQDTTKLILMTLLGLTIGLDLPVIAFLAAVCGWIAIYLSASGDKLDLDVRFSEKKGGRQAIDDLVAALSERGYKILSVNKAKFKAELGMVVKCPHGRSRDDLIRDMFEIQIQKSAPVEDWHVD